MPRLWIAVFLERTTIIVLGATLNVLNVGLLLG